MRDGANAHHGASLCSQRYMDDVKNRGAIALAEVQADVNLARFLRHRFGPLHRKSLLGLHAS
jgi:hypothetical protein